MGHPPLKVWIITLSIFSMVFLTVVLMTPRKKAFFTRKYVEHAFDESKANLNSTKAVFIGSSLLVYALDTDSILLDSQFGKKPNIDIIKIGIGGARLEDFLTKEYFIDKIQESKPSYILIQESLLQHVTKKSVPSLKSLMSRKDILHFWNGTYFTPWERMLSQHGVYADSASVIPAKIFNDIDPKFNSQILIEFMTRLGNIPIIVVEVPLPRKVEEGREMILRNSNYRSILSSLEKHYSVVFLRFDQQLHYKYFFDELHMNTAGKKIYTRWFWDQMNKIVAKDFAADA